MNFLLLENSSLGLLNQSLKVCIPYLSYSYVSNTSHSGRRRRNIDLLVFVGKKDSAAHEMGWTMLQHDHPSTYFKSPYIVAW